MVVKKMIDQAGLIVESPYPRQLSAELFESRIDPFQACRRFRPAMATSDTGVSSAARAGAAAGTC